MTDVIFQEGNDIIANNIGPVLNYEDGEITEFTIINNAENEQQAKFYLDISEISDSLKEESFKYLLQTSTDGTNYVTYKEGNFTSATIGELIISEDEILPSGRTYYRFIIYIDGNMENPTSMMNNNLKATFNVETSLPSITVAELVEQMKNSSNGVKANISDNVSTEKGIWETQDDYGTSYYFRGAVENNYVYFAGYYWRIMRANGNGTIRIIYDGTSAHSNGELSNDRTIGEIAYNSISSNYDNAYVGYMYGQIASSNYNDTHANTNNSTIKTFVDNWYKANIIDKDYNDYVADVIYCNDRSIYSGPGYGNSVMSNTHYSGYNRQTNKTAILTCTNQNDRFTVDDVNIGNGALTYPVGLITLDEVIYAGGYNSSSASDSYLDGLETNSIWWTMTPNIFSGGLRTAIIYTINNEGNLYTTNMTISNHVRPILSLKPSVELTGTGTMDEPYVVQ